jgi:hypothetical protein
MATTPTTEPATVVAGDTITWQKSYADYPATVWTLKYRLLNSATKIDITATASGDDFLVSVTSTTSATWAAGAYDYTAWVEKSGERVTVELGRITVKANMAVATTFDGRSDARIIYEALIAAYKTAVASRAYVAEYEIAGRRMKFSSREEWLKELNFWKAQVVAEDRAEKIASGQPAGARVLVRF